MSEMEAIDMLSCVVLQADTSRVPREDQSIDFVKTHLDKVADALFEIEAGDERLSDADVSVQLTEDRVELSITVEAETLDEAASIGRSALRAAIHAADGFTPDWDAKWAVEFSADDDCDDSASLTPA